MSSLSQFLDPYRVCIVTGASSGIGRSFVGRIRELNGSVKVFNLSRSRPDRFSEGPWLIHRTTDLSLSQQVEEAAQWVLEQVAELGPGRVLLINNAGFGGYGHFPDPSVEEQCDMLAVDVGAPLRLTGRLLPLLRERGGAIVNVSSVAAFQPTPYMATYGACKAFLLEWSLALGRELRGSGVRVLAVCPGPTQSNFYRRAGFATPPAGRKPGKDTPEQVVESALRALARGRTLVIPGWRNFIAAELSHSLPKTWQAALAGEFLRRLRLEKHKAGR